MIVVVMHRFCAAPTKRRQVKYILTPMAAYSVRHYFTLLPEVKTLLRRCTRREIFAPKRGAIQTPFVFVTVDIHHQQIDKQHESITCWKTPTHAPRFPSQYSGSGSSLSNTSKAFAAYKNCPIWRSGNITHENKSHKKVTDNAHRDGPLWLHPSPPKT